jgi:hypothetical protein
MRTSSNPSEAGRACPMMRKDSGQLPGPFGAGQLTPLGVVGKALPVNDHARLITDDPGVMLRLPRFAGQVDYAASAAFCWWILASYSGLR